MSDKFKVHPSRGIIQVAGVLFTDVGDYNLTVIATDNGAPVMSAEATVYLRMDRNFNSPVFTGDYSEQVSEYASIGHEVVKVRATDADPPSSPSGQLTYSLEQGLSDGALDYLAIGVGNDPGSITVNGSLKDFPTDDIYLQVKASDKGVPPNAASASIHIK